MEGFWDIVNSLDAARIAIAASNASDWITYGQKVWELWYPMPAIIVGMAFAMFLVYTVPKVPVVAGSVYAWWSNRKGESAMRKEREDAQREGIKNVLVDHIEDEVTEGRMTRSEANDWYAKFYKTIPDLREAIDDPPTLLERLASYKINSVRAPVDPAPLPKEVAAPARSRSRG